MNESEATTEWPSFRDAIASILGSSPDTVTPTSRLVTDLGFDSLALTELTLYLLDTYDLVTTAESLEAMPWGLMTARELLLAVLGASSASRPGEAGA